MPTFILLSQPAHQTPTGGRIPPPPALTDYPADSDPGAVGKMDRLKSVYILSRAREASSPVKPVTQALTTHDLETL